MKKNILFFFTFFILSIYSFSNPIITISNNHSSNSLDILPGKTIIYTIRAEYTGNASLTGYSISDTIGSLNLSPPTNISATSSGASAGTTTIDGSGNFTADSITFDGNGSLEFVTYTYETTIQDDFIGNVDNTASIYDATPTEITNSTDSFTTKDPINITKTSTDDYYTENSVLNYTLTIENPTNRELTNVSIIDDFSTTGLTSVKITSVSTTGINTDPVLSNADDVTNGININNAIIGPNGSITYEISGTVPSGTTSTIVNNASASYEGITKNDSISHDPISINFTYTSPTNTYDNGDKVNFQISISNPNNYEITNLEILNDFNGFGLTNLEVQVNESGPNTDGVITTGSLTGDEIDIPNATLGPLGSIIYFIEGTVNATQSDPIITNTEVNFGGMTETSNLTHNRIVYDYTIAKSVDPSQVVYSPGEEIFYELLLTNNADNTIKGLKIDDLISTLTVETTTGTGPAFDLSTLDVTAQTTGVGSSSGLTSNPFIGDLHVTNAIIGPHGSITYMIHGFVSDNAVGEIKNTAIITETTRNDNIKKSDEVIIRPGAPIINVSKSATKTSDYKPGDNIVYTITVSNTGVGYGEEYTISDVITALTTNLANDVNQAENSVDIVGSPFESTSVVLKSIGANSISSNYTVNVSQDNLDLLDKVFIAPNESVTYEISTKINKVAIGDIENSFNVLGTSGFTLDSDTVTTTPQPLNTDLSTIEIRKTTTLSEYEPGEEVTYDIHITNNDPDKYVNNFNLVDLINQIEAQQISGLSGPAFSSWKLEVVSPTSSDDFTKPGTPITSVFGSTDVNINVDLGPQETVSYRLTAIVDPSTIGQIVDKSPIGSDNVDEIGEGIVMSSPKLAITKTVDSSEYSPNQVLTYEITLENSGLGYAIDVPIIDAISTITTSTGDSAYSSWSITSRLEKVPNGHLNPTGDSGLSAPTIYNQDLNVLADIGPESQIVYVITATIDGKATGIIKNEVSADGSLVADKGSFPMDPKVSARKEVNKNRYSALDNTLSLEYTITVENDSSAGFAKDVQVYDDFNAIGVTLLNGTTLNQALENISVTMTTVGSGTSSATNGALTSGVLTDTVQITAGGYIEYKVTGDIIVDFDKAIDIIPYGDIINEAIITPTDININPDTPINISATTSPKSPDLEIIKSTTNSNFSNNGTVTYKILVDNIGEGYAYNAKVTDFLDPSIFSSWTITSRSDGDSNPSYRGSDSNLSGGTVEDNKSLDALVNIKPKGFVEYTIVAVVDGSYSSDDIINTAEVFDNQSKNTYASSVSLSRSDKGLYTTKTVDNLTHIPGQPLVYTVTVFNTTGQDVNFTTVGCYVVDKFSDMNVTLANDGTTPITDLPNQFPFTNMAWTGTDSSGSNSTNGTIAENTDFRHQPIIPALDSTGTGYGFYTYTITVDVKDNVLPERITNSVVIEENNVEFSKSFAQTNAGGNYGGISRDVDDKYIPGQPITYTFTVSGGSNGYLNDFDIDEKINDIEVLLLNGTMGNPFYNSTSGINEFTVSMARTNTNGDPISSGTSNPSSPSNNSDISETVDIAPNDVITYTVTGIIRPDADGDIAYKGLLTEPYRHNLDLSKVGSPTAYIPGEDITFDINIDNNSDGNAKDISVVDLLSQLTVDLVDGTVGTIFVGDSWTITPSISQSPLGTSDYTQYASVGTVSADTDINTTFNLPIHTRITYSITGEVNPLAIGTIRNTATIDGDQVTGEIGPARPGLIGDKTINAYFDRTGTQYTNATDEYQPGGWIEYYLILENKGDGFFDNFPVSDLLSEVKTTYVDGSQGPAYSTWEINKIEETGVGTEAGIGLTFPLTDIDFVETPTTDPDQRQLLIDIAPAGKIIISIKAKIDERARGDIENIAYSRTSFRSSGKSTMFDPEVSLEKIAYNLDGSIKTEYLVGDKFYYTIKVTNNGLGTSLGTLEDLLSQIETQIPGNGSPTGGAYANWSIQSSKRNDSESSWTTGDTDGVTSLDNFESPNNNQSDVDINSPNIIIASGGVLEYRVDVEIIQDALSAITNTVTYSDQVGIESADNTITPPLPQIELTKEIVSIDGVPYVSGMKYKPEDIIIYKITATNTGTAFGNNIRIRDRIVNLRAEVAGGGDQLPFSTWNVQSDGGLNPLSFVQNKYINGTVVDTNLNAVVDIAPNDIITFTVTATIKDNIVGDVPENTVDARDTKNGNTQIDEKKAGPVTQEDPDISYYKSFFVNSAEATSFEYVPFGQIIYKIDVKNNGEGYGDNISIVDILKDIVDGNGSPAFTNSASLITILDKNGVQTNSNTDTKNVVTGTYSGLNGLDASMDIEPGAEITFYFEVTVSGTAIGDITNTVSVPDGTVDPTKQDTVTATLSNAEVRLIKTGDGTYSPGQPAKYQLTIKNLSSSTADNIIITDIFKNIMVETVDGSFKPAFKPHSTKPWKITAVVSDDRANSNISNLTNEINNNLEDSIDNISVRLGTRSTTKQFSQLVIDFEGTIIDDAIGNIFNRGQIEYLTDTFTADHFILPVVATINNIDLTKRAVVSKSDNTKVVEYTPGSNQTFLIEVTNNNSTYAMGIDISDDIASLLTSGAGSFAISGGTTNEIPVFDPSTIDSDYNVVDSSDADSTLSIVSNIDTSKGFEGTVDLAPGDTLKIWITGKINDEVMLPISNTVNLDFNGSKKSATDSLISVSNTVTIEKEISLDGITYSDGPIYYDTGDTIYYKLIAENDGYGWANDIQIVDNITAIEALQSGGGLGLAFDSSTIMITHPTTVTPPTIYDPKYVITDSSTDNLVTTFDLAPKTTIEFLISAQLNSNILGNVDNSAIISSTSGDIPDGNTNTVVAESNLVSSDNITIFKEIIGGQTEYSAGDTLKYRITVANTGSTFAHDLRILDEINSIKVESSLGSTTVDPFKAFTVSPPTFNAPTTIISSDYTNGIDALIDLAPNESIFFEISAETIDTAIGNIENIAKYSYGGNIYTSNTVTTTPKKANLSILKTTSTPLAIPNGSVEYTVVIQNLGEGIANDISFTDEISKVVATLSNGTIGKVFIDNSITATIETASGTYPSTPILTVDTSTNATNNDISSSFDLGPNGYLEIKITGTLVDNIVDEIKNTASYTFTNNGETTPTTDTSYVDIEVANADVELTKMAIIDPAVGGYLPGEYAEFNITVENKGLGIANNITITDLLSQVEVTTLNGKQPAFESWTIDLTNSGNVSTTDLPLTYLDDTDLNTLADIGPGDTVIFNIKAKVISEAFDDITNIASLQFENDKHNDEDDVPQIDSDATIIPSRSEVVITKDVDLSEYAPGDKITYSVKLENLGPSIAKSVEFNDTLPYADASNTSSGLDHAFDYTTGSIDSIIILGGAIQDIPIGFNGNALLSTVTLPKGGSIEYIFSGNVASNIVGEIDNSASFVYTDNDGTDKFASDSATTTPKNAELVITKTTDSLLVPGQPLTYTVSIKNNGEGIANDVKIIDDILDIQALSSSGTDTQAFTSVTITDNNTSLLSPISNIGTYDTDKNLDVLVDIAPNDEVIFTLVGVVADSIVGEILNSAYYDFTHNDGVDDPSNNGSSTASSTSSNATIIMDKTVDKLNYIAGEEITYTITLENTGTGIADNIKVIDNILDILATSTSGVDIQAITNITVTDNSSTLNTPTTINMISGPNNANLEANVDIAPNDKVIFTIVGTVADSIVGEIINTASYEFTNNDGTNNTNTSEAVSKPSNAKLEILKTSSDTDFIPGNPITYEISITNSGFGIANDVTLTDDILDILVKSVYGDDINAFTDVIITDNSSTLNPISTIQPYDTDQNLDVTFDLIPNDTIVFTLVATTDGFVGEDITNRADFEFVNNDGTKESGYSEFTSKILLNQGELVLTKRAMKNRIEKGEMVEYEILVRNTTDSFFTGIEVIDDTPAGFNYINDSTEIILSTDDSLDDNNDTFYTDNPNVGDILTFKSVNIAPKEILRIRYVLRANIGTTFGDYVNTAHTYGSGRVVSNYDSASVEVIPSALFDSGTIIGKVFEDLNGDGYQADATATGIGIIGATATGRYVPNSTTLEIDGKATKLKDASSPLEKGIEVGSLRGISLNRDLKEHSKAVIRYEATDSIWEPITLTTDDGTHITMDEKGKITEDHKGKVSKDLANEKIKITRNTYKLKNSPNYLHEIIIENFGIYEDGIPGVRLITVEGYVIDTDEFGRYHVPDQWITSGIGSNFIVKVDPDSLPQGMEVTSENPRVRRITSSSLNRFNFSVQREADNFEVKNEDEVNRIGGNEDE